MNCVVNPLLQAMGEQPSGWEVVIFQDQSANAFALPGKKIGVHTGLLKVAKTDSQLATVLGHEIGHVLARHGVERFSHQFGSQVGLVAVNKMAADDTNKNVILGLLGVGVQVGVLLPFSRKHETEADLMGLQLMAEAGFDPRQSVELWKNMIIASEGKAPPEWLSTHPRSENRITQLQNQMPRTLETYLIAQKAGKLPHCSLPPE